MNYSSAKKLKTIEELSKIFPILSMYQYFLWISTIKIFLRHLNVSRVSWFSIFSNISMQKKFSNHFLILLHLSHHAYSIDAINFIYISIMKRVIFLTTILPHKSFHSTWTMLLFQLAYFIILNRFPWSIKLSGKTNVFIWSMRLVEILINTPEELLHTCYTYKVFRNHGDS